MFLFYAPKIRHYLSLLALSHLTFDPVFLKKTLLKTHSFLHSSTIFESTRSDKKHEQVLPERHIGSMPRLPLASCVIQPHLQQSLLSEVDSKYIADDDKLWRHFAIWAITHWTIDLESAELIYRSNEMVRHIISTELCTGPPINAAQWSLLR